MSEVDEKKFMEETQFQARRLSDGELVTGWFVGYSEAMGFIYGDYIDKGEVWEVDPKTVAPIVNPVGNIEVWLEEKVSDCIDINASLTGPQRDINEGMLEAYEKVIQKIKEEKREM